MALAAKLEFRQRQALIVTPQLQQAIKLLQLSNLDLQIFVERELEQNPFLERDAETDGGDGPPNGDDPALFERPPPSAEERPDLADALRQDATVAEALEPDYHEHSGDFYTESGWASLAPGGRGADAEFSHAYDDFASKPDCLTDHLTSQLLLATSCHKTRLIGHYLIDTVDEAGYMRACLDQAAADLAASPEAVEAALKLLQGFEPAGVCARNLRECLRLQLLEKNRLDPIMTAVIEHLDLVASQDFGRLRRLTGINAEDLDDALAELKSLNPKPGLKFGAISIDAVIPDVFVKRRRGGGWHVEINNETLPKLLINQSYYASVCGSAKSDGEKSYMGACMTTANWLVKSLDQRTRTILKVAQEIVVQQDAFLVHGVRYLKPLNLRDIAEKIGMHESTVSRVTSNKYMATPRGQFELKYFFTSAIQSAGYGESHSSEAVRHRIKLLIEAETAGGVLSDDQIVSILRRDGVDIARRTVAKYREALRIPSSVQRRRQKRMALARAY